MPRSSRHKSSKHSSRDAKDYSDSEMDSSSKDKRGREENAVRVSKDSALTEKRKLDTKDAKDFHGSGNGEYLEEHGSSKRRRERGVDATADRWNGGGDDDRREGPRNSKISGDLKNKRRDESVGHGDGEELKRSSGKGEGRSREPSRKETRDAGVERERKGKEGKSDRSDRVFDNEEHRMGKQIADNTDSIVEDVLLSPRSENQLEGRSRRKRDGPTDVNKHQDDIDVNDRRLPAKDDSAKDGRQKDEKRKDDRYKEKYWDVVEKESKHRDDKQREKRTAKDRISSSTDEKHLRDEKDSSDLQQRKNKHRDSDHDRDHNGNRDWDLDSTRERDRDRDRDRGHYRDREHDRNRGRDRSRERDRDYDRGHERDRDHDHDSDRDRDRDHERDRDRVRDLDRKHDRDGSHLDERSAKHKNSRGRKRSPDDGIDTKSVGVKAQRADVEKKSSCIDIVESDAKRGGSQTHSTHVDAFLRGNRRRTSPNSSSLIGADEYRHPDFEELKYRDSTHEQRSKATSSRELTGFSGELDKVGKYRSTEKFAKTDDGHMSEKSSSSKASPLGFPERSPSSSNIDRRQHRSSVRRSLEIEETGRRSSASIDMRDDDRVSRDLQLEKPLIDESSQADSSFYNRASQSGTSSLVPPPPAFRAGVDSPSFVGSLEDDGRANTVGRYRRSSDPSVGRMHGNAWRGWTSPVANGFIPFQHGPHHGGFQPMMPQFPTPPLFGVRPMDVNHSGLHYHIPDAERFSSHFRPLGWQHVMDNSGPSNLHGWDGSNGVFRDEPHIYRGAEWDQNRNLKNGRGWESNAAWKGQNGDMNRDLASSSYKDDHAVHAQVDDISGGSLDEMSQHEDSPRGTILKPTELRSNVASPAKESSNSLPEPTPQMEVYSPKTSGADSYNFSRVYLSKLEISAELTDPELYDQCMDLLETQQCSSADDDTTINIFFENGARAGQKSSNIVQSFSLFTPIKDAVFQKAMDLYKKQIMEARDIGFVSGGTLDIMSASNEEKTKEEPSDCAVGRSENPVQTDDAEMTDAVVSPLDKNAEVVLITAENKSEQINAIPSEEVQSYENSKGTSPNILLGKDEITSPKLVSSDGDIDGIGKTEENLLPRSTEGKVCFDETVKGPLFFPEGSSSKTCEALMSGSNESDSVILSRIHHSPESTH